MFPLSLRPSSAVLHLALGLIIAIEGGLNLYHALAGPGDSLLMVFGAAEAIGALMFMWPRALPIGGCVLVCTFLIAAVVHLSSGDFPSEHLVYAVAVLFVMTQGDAWRAPYGRVAA